MNRYIVILLLITIELYAIKINAKQNGDIVTVKAMIINEMLTFEQAVNKGVEQTFVTHITARVGGRIVYDLSMDADIAKNPIVKFKYKYTGQNDTIKLIVTDNKGHQTQLSAPIVNSAYNRASSRSLSTYPAATDYRKSLPQVWKSTSVEEAVNALYGPGEAISGKINITTTNMAATRDFIPLTVQSDVDMESLALFLTGNDKPALAVFKIGENEIVDYSLKMKSKRGCSIQVVAIAKARDGKLYKDVRNLYVAASSHDGECTEKEYGQDCESAETPLLKAMCVNPQLATLSRQLGVTYLTLTEKSDKSMLNKLASEHNQWLESRGQECPQYGGKCLTRSYKKRMKYYEYRLEVIEKEHTVASPDMPKKSGICEPVSTDLTNDNANTITSLSALKAFIKDGQSSGYVPKTIGSGLVIVPNKPGSGLIVAPNKLEPVDISMRSIIRWNDKSKCTDSSAKIILALGDENQSIRCNGGDTVIMTGQGNDFIHDSNGNDIFYTGKGNDTIEASHGSDIFIFEKNWGHDEISFRPMLVNTSDIVGYDGSYPWKAASFIIFGKQINRSDIYLDGDTLVHAKTCDTIKLSSKNINLVFANEDNAQIKDRNFVPLPKKTKVLSIDELKGESVLFKGNIAYLVGNGLQIIDFKDPKKPVLLSTTYLTGVTMSVKIRGDIAYVSQAAPHYSEGAGGWVSMVDIKDPLNPKVLKTLKFANNIFNIAVNGAYLYVADTNFSHRNKRALFIYDVSTPQSPKLLSRSRLENYSRFMAYSNGLLFLSTFKRKVTIMDVTDPKNPEEMPQSFQFTKKVLGIKSDKNRVVINQDGNTVSLFETTANQNVRHVCDAKTRTEHPYSSISDSAITLQNDLIYRAELKEGVSIIDAKDCRLKKTIPFKNMLVFSVDVVDDQLLAFSQSKMVMHDLTQNENIISRLRGLFASDAQPKKTEVKRIRVKSFIRNVRFVMVQKVIKKHLDAASSSKIFQKRNLLRY